MDILLFAGIAVAVFIVVLFAMIIGAVTWRLLRPSEENHEEEYNEVAPTVAEEPTFPHGEPKS